MLVFQILFGIIIVLFAAWLIWRFSSRRTSIPCPYWLGWLVEMENPFAKDYNASRIIDHLGPRPGMRVLDAGCGPGRLTIPLAKTVGPEGEVVAVDIQPEMLNRAEAKAREAGLNNIDFRESAIGGGTLETGQFDRAVLVAMLGEIPDQQAAMRELGRALKPDGILSVSEVIFDPHFQRRESIIRVAEAGGLRGKAFFGNRLAFTLLLEKQGRSSPDHYHQGGDNQ